MQLFHLYEEGHPGLDRVSRTVRIAERTRRSDYLHVQYENRQAYLLRRVRHPSLLRAAFRPGQDRRQRPLPGRRRSCCDHAKTIRWKELGGVHAEGRALEMNECLQT